MQKPKLTAAQRLRVLASGDIEPYVSPYVQAYISGDDVQPADDVKIAPETAMKLSVVNACIRVRAETFASVPLKLYRKKEDGREEATDHPLCDMLHACPLPDGEMSSFTFKETLSANFDAAGNAVCVRLKNGAGELVGLQPVGHGSLDLTWDKAKQKVIYKIGGKEYPRSELLHVPNLSFDGRIGLSPLEYAAQSIRLGLNYEQFSTSFYKNAAMPSGVFEHPSSLSDAAFNRLREDLRKNYTGMGNRGVPMILEEGMEWKPVTYKPAEAQLLESKQFQVEDICRIFRVPQHLVNKLDRSTYSNIEQQQLEFIMFTMLPVFRRFEDCINSQLLTPQDRRSGLYAEFNIDGLLRGDQKSRAEAYALGRQWGWLSVNDICRLENRQGIGEQGDIYLYPVNMGDARSLTR